VAPVLVFACGNPSRGDDALGPALAQRIEADLADEVAVGRLEVLSDFQLQVEHALDLVGRTCVVFVDAAVAGPVPFEWSRVQTVRDATFSTHALSPAAVLAAYRDALGDEPPPAHLLAVRGRGFELGAPLSAEAAANLEAAADFVVAWLRQAVQGRDSAASRRTEGD
jgi:hydrogenase maturation protease